MYKYALLFLIMSSNNLMGQIDREKRLPDGGGMRKMDLRDRGLDSISDRGSEKVAKMKKPKLKTIKSFLGVEIQYM